MTAGYVGQNVDPVADLRRAISAHRAVSEGIATHAEKHRAAREARQNKMKADQELRKPLGHAGSRLYGDTAICRNDRPRLLAGNLVGAGRLARAGDLLYRGY